MLWSGQHPTSTSRTFSLGECADSGFIVPALSQYVTLAIMSLCWCNSLFTHGFCCLSGTSCPGLMQCVASDGGTDLMWDVPVQTCLLSCACSALGVCTPTLCSGKPLSLLERSPSQVQPLPQVQAVEALCILANADSSVRVTEFPQRWLSVHLVNSSTAWNSSSFLEKCCKMKSKATCLVLLHLANP